MPGRNFDRLSEAQLIAGRTDTRRVHVAPLVRTTEPRRVSELLDAIDQIAEAAIGERSFLHVKPTRIGR
ncbi:hypothetical protein ASG40_06815 [Methylobacterium sp. Leaf399]|uniref:hypothetical protein n=1 Tax=unclassified Methylobacterium TaxID=2615210 RepID=UPI0006F90E04|nr:MULTISPECIES: hypothetical protein [unclassified Methylobacterium]KQT12029.1 hypothetical protein ASG40_06815 [Methylobacterium sp. Leaf399]KQT84497.1 hypothetical protein ASG59_02410 [Methylobacterium sp. Leaf466]